jgi:hypothetical protein
VDGEATLGAPIDKAAVGLGGVTKGNTMPHGRQGTAVGMGAAADGEGFNKRIRALGLVQAVAAGVLDPANLGDVEDVGGVEMGGLLWMALVTKRSEPTATARTASKAE